MTIDWNAAQRDLEAEGAVLFACKRGQKPKDKPAIPDGLPSEKPLIAKPGQSLFTKVPPHPAKR